MLWIDYCQVKRTLGTITFDPRLTHQKSNPDKFELSHRLCVITSHRHLMTCSNEQLRILMKYAQTCSRQVAAAKAGMSLSTAKRYLRMGGKRKERTHRQRSWRTRPDPLAGVWPQLEALLEREPGLQAKTLLEWLQREQPGQAWERSRRTLERRVRQWKSSVS